MSSTDNLISVKRYNYQSEKFLFWVLKNWKNLKISSRFWSAAVVESGSLVADIVNFHCSYIVLPRSRYSPLIPHHPGFCGERVILLFMIDLHQKHLRTSLHFDD